MAAVGEDISVKAAPPLLEVDGVSRSFGRVRALTEVSLHVNPHEVVGLIGENGAGKSTLLNILCGVDKADEGEVRLRGNPAAFKTYHEANSHGVFRIFQELALVPNVSVYENLFVSHESHFETFGLIRHRRMRQRAAEIFERFGHEWIDPRATVASYDFSARQVIEIIKAFALADLLNVEMPVILLDEPTAGLSREEADFFAQLITSMRAHAGILFVSHRLSELLELSDRVYVLKDGAVVDEPDPRTCSEQDLHYLMVGRERDVTFYKEAMQREPEDSTALEVKDLTCTPHFESVDFALRRGEILGIAGVVGSGKSELARAVFGDLDKVGGEIRVADREMTRLAPLKMLDAGVGYVSPDRATDGIVPAAPVSWNMSIAWLSTAERSVLLRLRREREIAEEQIRQLGIRTASVKTPIVRLSGGNQQKAILARWLAAGVQVLILDNPTKGIDAGARTDVYEILRNFTAAGGAILLVSDELVELIGLSNRVLAMKDGRVVSEVSAPVGAKPHEADLLKYMV